MTRTAGLLLATTGPQATQALGAAIAAHLRPGDVVALSGELGAGKTCLVQGAARHLQVPGRVTSPTFVLARTYHGTIDVVHVDVYRLNRLQDVFELGDEVFAPDVVTFVEWGDAVAAALPDDRLEVDLRLADDLDLDRPATVVPPRRIAMHGQGNWEARLAALAAECAPWVATDPEAGTC